MIRWLIQSATDVQRWNVQRNVLAPTALDGSRSLISAPRRTPTDPADRCDPDASVRGLGAESPKWLSEVERSRLAGFKVEKRRKEWLLGRWTAKRLLQSYLWQELGVCPPLEAIIIGRGPGGVPVPVVDPAYLPDHAAGVSLTASACASVPLVAEGWRKPGDENLIAWGVPLSLSLSISHSHDWALAATMPSEHRSSASIPGPSSIASSSGLEGDAPGKIANGSSAAASGVAVARVGADIERIEPRSSAFIQQFFVAEEQAWLQQVATGGLWNSFSAAPGPLNPEDTIVTAIWSAKEAVLKALHLGLTVDTRRVTCLPAVDAGSIFPFSEPRAGTPANLGVSASMPGVALPPAADATKAGWLPVQVRCEPGLTRGGASSPQTDDASMQRGAASARRQSLEMQGDESAAGTISCWWRLSEQQVLTVALWQIKPESLPNVPTH